MYIIRAIFSKHHISNYIIKIQRIVRKQALIILVQRLHSIITYVGCSTSLTKILKLFKSLSYLWNIDFKQDLKSFVALSVGCFMPRLIQHHPFFVYGSYHCPENLKSLVLPRHFWTIRKERHLSGHIFCDTGPMISDKPPKYLSIIFILW